MKRRTYSILMVFAASFALILGLGSFQVVKAVPGTSEERINANSSDVNLVGIDGAKNSLKATDRNRDSKDAIASGGTFGARDLNKPTTGAPAVSCPEWSPQRNVPPYHW